MKRILRRVGFADITVLDLVTVILLSCGAITIIKFFNIGGVFSTSNANNVQKLPPNIVTAPPTSTPKPTTIKSIDNEILYAHEADLIFIGYRSPKLADKLSDIESNRAFFQYIEKQHVVCKKTSTLGSLDHRGWGLCLVPPYEPSSPCIIYSIGVSQDYSFEDAALNTYGCTVRTLNISSKAQDHVRRENIVTYKWNGHRQIIKILNNTSVWIWNNATVVSLINKFGDAEKIIDYFRFDIQYSEFSAMEYLLQSGIFSRVRQLAIEVYYIQNATAKQYQAYTNILGRLEKTGMRRWLSMPYYPKMVLRSNKEGFRSCCYRLVYINTNFLQEL